MTEKEAAQLCAQAGQGQSVPPPPKPNYGQTPDGVTSHGEENFADYWRLLCPHIGPPTPQHRPTEDRRWKIDFAWPELFLAVEIEGVGHRLSPRYEQDICKYNELAAMGWTLLRFTGNQILDDPDACIGLVAALVLHRLGLFFQEEDARLGRLEEEIRMEMNADDTSLSDIQ